MKNMFKRFFCFILIFSVLSLPVIPASAENTENGASLSDVKVWQYPRYSEYKSEYIGNTSSADTAVSVSEIEKIEGYRLIEEYQGQKGAFVFSSSEGFVSYSVDIPSAGAYQIELTCFLTSDVETTVQRRLEIDGEIPFREASDLTFDKIYVFEGGKYYKTLQNGSQVKNTRVEKKRWQTVLLRDSTGVSNEPLTLFLTKGKHTLTMKSVSGEMVIGAVRLVPSADLPSYSAYRAEQESKYGAPSHIHADTITVQAENMGERNSSALFGTSDISSPGATPFSYDKNLVNILSGSNFNALGDWVSYDFEVTVSGWYSIAFKYRQGYRSGGYVSRRICIDGAVPFEEADAFRFPYSTDWKTAVFGAEEESYYIYLPEGAHTLTLQAVTGDMSEIISRSQRIVDSLNGIYRSLFVITGPSPDPYRDYHFDEIAKEELEQLEAENNEIECLLKDVMALTKQRGSFLSAPEQLSVTIRNMVKFPDSIATWMSSFVSNLGSFSEWMLSLQEQAVDLDLIDILPMGETSVRAGTDFWDALIYQIRIFIRSFVKDYGAVRQNTEKPEIKVWLGSTGRDQANIMQELIEEGYMPNNGSVKLQFVTGALIPSTLAGIGPDVYMFAASTEPINYALRGAVEPLNEYDGFSEVVSRFSSQALMPYTYNNKAYAIPETEQYPMLFYRADILEDMNIPVPMTWDDVYNALSKLQSKHMTFGMLPDFTGYLMFLAQNGLSVYRDDGASVTFDNTAGISAFYQWTDFFVSYKLSTAYSFINRFRTGEMPLGIADFSTANQLRVSASEIDGMWGIAPLPGIKGEDGSINFSAPITSTANIIMKQSECKQEAWNFLKWWSSAEVQSEYSEQLEQTMGIAARYATANIEAFSKQNWNRADANAISKQRMQLVGVPEVPGSYIVSRYIGFAFSAVIDEGKDPVKALLDYSEKTNAELTRKSKEFQRHEQ